MEPNAAVGITTGLVTLTIAACVWFFGQQMTPRIVTAFTLGGATGLTGSRVGGWLHSGITWTNDRIGDALGALTGKTAVTEPGSILWAIGALVLLGFVAFRFWHKRIDSWVLLATAVLPFAVATIPGSAGATILGGIETIAGVVTWPIAALFGLN